MATTAFSRAMFVLLASQFPVSPVPGVSQGGVRGGLPYSSAPKPSHCIHSCPSPHATSREHLPLWHPVAGRGLSHGGVSAGRRLLDGPLSVGRERKGAGPLLGLTQARLPQTNNPHAAIGRLSRARGPGARAKTRLQSPAARARCARRSRTRLTWGKGIRRADQRVDRRRGSKSAKRRRLREKRPRQRRSITGGVLCSVWPSPVDVSS
jgi:hypothetical protein